MFSKVLLATDLSVASDRVVEYMETLRALDCREVVLTYVIYVKHLVGLSDALRDEATPRLDAQRAALEAEGFKVSVETPVGVPGVEITRLALDTGCKAIVIGSHGHSLARDIALGGVATDVVHRAELPVLVVRLQILEEEPQCCQVVSADVLSHVLYATDFSDNAERAFQYVEAFAKSGCKTMTLMHVQDVSRIRPHLEEKLQEFNEIDRSRLERMALRLRDLGVGEIDLQIPYGVPAKEIVDYVQSNCPSIVVMGTHGRGFISDIFAGSVSHNVVRLSQSPVLLIPPVR
ncbi:MAG: universal stress protein [Armatimonadetes bacterium]|nr:universal stress protein [Armatimonadota bacterium]